MFRLPRQGQPGDFALASQPVATCAKFVVSFLSSYSNCQKRTLKRVESNSRLGLFPDVQKSRLQVSPPAQLRAYRNESIGVPCWICVHPSFIRITEGQTLKVKVLDDPIIEPGAY